MNPFPTREAPLKAGELGRALAAGAAALLGVGILTGVLSGGPSRARAASPDRLPAEGGRAPDAGRASVATVEDGAAKPAEASFARYAALLRRNPFAPQLPPRAEPTGGTKPPALPPADRTAAPPAPPVPAPPAPPDPLQGWTYSGTVVIGSDVYAVLENSVAKQSQYVRTGDAFLGGRIGVIGETQLAIEIAGGLRSLPKSSAFNATPLNAPGQPGGQPGAQPGAQPGGPGQPAPGGPGAPPSGAPPGAATPAAPGPAAAPIAVEAISATSKR